MWVKSCESERKCIVFLFAVQSFVAILDFISREKKFCVKPYEPYALDVGCMMLEG